MTLGTTRPAKSKRTSIFYEQIEWAIYVNWVNPEKICTPLKIIANLYPAEKQFKKVVFSGSIPCHLSLEHLTVPNENVHSVKDSKDKKFEMLLKTLSIAGCALQPAIAAVSVCQRAANYTRTMNNQQDPLFQDHTLTE